ncbi:MAG: nitrilase-related carbon-nitrogen hydrolase [Candidatus Gallimonas sp.]
MRICFVSDGDLNDYEEKHAGANADVVCFTFRALGRVSYERELRGETSLFEDAALLSKVEQNVVVCGCYTDARGIRRKSVVVAERGRILGVSDMVNCIDGEEYRCGAGIKIYETKVGKIGVVVAEDLYFPQVLQTLSLCGAELAICIFEELNETLEQTLMRAEAFFYGLPVCMCAYGYAQAADVSGRICFASPESPCIYEPEQTKEFHLVETRQRGFSRRKKNNY